MRQVLADCGAENTLAVQISGPSGVCIAADEFDRRIAFEDLATAGAFMVFDASRDMFEVARNFVHFFAHESCGFCTPCRVGTAMLKATMDKIAAGHGTQYDLREIDQLDRILQPVGALRPRPHRLQPDAGHAETLPPDLRAAAEIARFRARLRPRRRAGGGAPHDRPRRCRRAFENGDRGMSETFQLDNEDVPFTPGQTVLQAALTAGRYIPHLCYHPEFKPHGSCKVCTVKIGGGKAKEPPRPAPCRHRRGWRSKAIAKR